LALQLSLASLCSFNLSSLRGQSSLLLLGFCLSSLLPPFLFFLLDLSSLNLFLERPETSGSSFAFVGEFFFLSSSIVLKLLRS
jgi:hypothetical protein